MPHDYVVVRTRDTGGTMMERCELTPREVYMLRADVGVTALVPDVPIRGPSCRPSAPQDPGWVEAAVGISGVSGDGSGVTVALLDGGIDASHPGLAGIPATVRDFTGGGDRRRSGNATALLARMCGRTSGGFRIGVAPGVERALMGCVLDDSGAGRLADFLEAALWAAQGGARVIAVAFEVDLGPEVEFRRSSGWPPGAALAYALALHHACARALDRVAELLATEHGALIVAAAGDGSARSAVQTAGPRTMPAGLPAALPGVLTVGAIAQHPAGLVVAPFSNRDVSICAPGVDVLSAADGGSFAAFHGTAIAAASVAGIAALWAQRLGRSCTTAELRARLLAAARLGVFATEPDPSDVGAGVVSAPR